MSKVRLAAVVLAFAMVVGAVGCSSDGDHTIIRSGSGDVVPESSE